MNTSAEDILTLFRIADAEAFAVMGTTSPNPPVGAIIVDEKGSIIGRGGTQPPGGPHAEVMAVQAALGRRSSLKGCRAVVTLEPCNHTGRTGPCAQLLIEAGVSRVDFLFADPNGEAAGGADTLRRAGVEVHGPYRRFPLENPEGEYPWALEPWLTSVVHARPHVTLKWASTVDGHIAAKDGSSQWITGSTARATVHKDRSRRDAIVVGTGTIAADNPRLTARDADGRTMNTAHQPLRVVMGQREIPADAAIIGDDGKFLHIPTRNVDEVLSTLWDWGVRSLIVEGGSHIMAAFLRAGVADEIHAYIAPAILGGGSTIFQSILGETMGDIVRFAPRQLDVLSPDLRWILTRTTPVEK